MRGAACTGGSDSFFPITPGKGKSRRFILQKRKTQKRKHQKKLKQIKNKLLFLNGIVNMKKIFKIGKQALVDFRELNKAITRQ